MRFRLTIAIIASLIFHAIVIFGFSSLAELNCCRRQGIDSALINPTLSANVLRVGFLFSAKKDVTPGLKSTEQRLIPELDSLGAHSKEKDQVKINIQNSKYFSPQTGTIKIAEDYEKYVEVSKFLRPNAVDIRAIPLRGVEIPASNRVVDAAVVFKLRIFIDKNGVVVQVDDLSEVSFESVSFSLIEKEIMNTLFLPAKKNGSPVDSYIEVELKG